MREAAPEVQRWTTDVVPEAQRFDYYASALSEAITPMGVTRRLSSPFHAEIAAAVLGPVTTVRVQGTPHGCTRGAREIAHSGERHFRLILNQTSTWNLTHRGSLHLHAGDAVLLDSRVAHTTDLHGPFDVLHLKLPEAWVLKWLPNPDALVGRAFSSAGPWGRTLVSFIAQLSPEFVATAPLPADLLAEQIGALLALVASDSQGLSRPVSSAQRALHERIKDHVLQRCVEPSLSAAEVAASLGISPRTLHRTLALFGEAFGSLLIAARGDTAMRMLESPMFSRLTIGEIAKRAGFLDASHFSRVIRRRSGLSPSQLRKARLGIGS